MGPAVLAKSEFTVYYMRNMYFGCHAFVVEILVLVRAHPEIFVTVEWCSLYPETCI